MIFVPFSCALVFCVGNAGGKEEWISGCCGGSERSGVNNSSLLVAAFRLIVQIR